MLEYNFHKEVRRMHYDADKVDEMVLALLCLAASKVISAAESKNIVLHENRWVTRLAIGRASMMPNISPLITFPTTWPLDPSGARCAAHGTKTWTATAPRPVTIAAKRKGIGLWTEAVTIVANMQMSMSKRMRRRFSIRSPSGTIKSSPKQYPIWVIATINPAAAADNLSAELIGPTSGCA
jgi:hypothetical protein